MCISTPQPYTQQRCTWQSMEVSVCSHSSPPPLPRPATTLTFFPSMKSTLENCLPQENSPFTERNERARNICPSWWGQRGFTVLQSHLPTVQWLQQSQAPAPWACSFLMSLQVLCWLFCSSLCEWEKLWLQMVPWVPVQVAIVLWTVAVLSLGVLPAGKESKGRDGELLSGADINSVWCVL